MIDYIWYDGNVLIALVNQFCFGLFHSLFRSFFLHFQSVESLKSYIFPFFFVLILAKKQILQCFSHIDNDLIMIHPGTIFAREKKIKCLIVCFLIGHVLNKTNVYFVFLFVISYCLPFFWKMKKEICEIYFVKKKTIKQNFFFLLI